MPPAPAAALGDPNDDDDATLEVADAELSPEAVAAVGIEDLESGFAAFVSAQLSPRMRRELGSGGSGGRGGRGSRQVAGAGGDSYTLPADAIQEVIAPATNTHATWSRKPRRPTTQLASLHARQLDARLHEGAPALKVHPRHSTAAPEYL